MKPKMPENPKGANDFSVVASRLKRNMKGTKAPNDFQPPQKFRKPDVGAIQRRLQKNSKSKGS